MNAGGRGATRPESSDEPCPSAPRPPGHSSCRVPGHSRRTWEATRAKVPVVTMALVNYSGVWSPSLGKGGREGGPWDSPPQASPPPGATGHASPRTLALAAELERIDVADGVAQTRLQRGRAYTDGAAAALRPFHSALVTSRRVSSQSVSRGHWPTFVMLTEA